MNYRNSTFDRLYVIVGMPWLFLMLFTSGQYTALKIILLFLLVLIVYIEIKKHHLRFYKPQVKYVILFVTYCLFSLLFGILCGYDFNLFSEDFSLIQSCFFTPIIIVMLVAVFSVNEERRNYIWRALKYLTLLLAVLDILKLVLFMMGSEPSFLNFIMLSSTHADSELTLRVSNESSFFFLSPIYIYLLLNPSKNDNKWDRFIYLIITFLTIVYSILSGRKVLELEIVFCFIFSIIYNRGHFQISNLFTASKIKFYIISIFAFLSILIIFENLSELIGLDSLLDLAYETIKDGFSSDSHGVSKRVENTRALLDMFLYSPIWGHGLNSYAVSSMASTTTKWSYEVIYAAWLAQTGLIGTIIFFRGVIYIIRSLHFMGRITQDNRYYAILLGFICFIIAGASNPLVYFVWPWSIAMIYGSVKYNKTSNEIRDAFG